MSILEVSHIQKSFGKNHVLKDISFSMDAGSVMSIIGSSGSGKTTLLRCINFLDADEGKITVDGNVIFDSKNPKKLTKKQHQDNHLQIGLVFQDFNLFPQYTVRDNIMLSPLLHAKKRAEYKKNKQEIVAQIRNRADELIAKMGLTDKADLYPRQLSGGQKQRVSIARAMALDPKILFFDEPTSALDPELTGEVLKVIRELAEEKMTMVIVTHEMAFAKEVSDHIIFMDQGVIAEEGEAKQLIENPQTERLQAFLSKITK